MTSTAFRQIVPLAVCAAAAALAMGGSAAQAQGLASRSWVSGGGDDAAPCTRAQPCLTFAGALAKTAAGGEIDAIDAGGFGAVTITKAITIRAAGVNAGALVSAGNGITIAAGAGDKVVLDGIEIEGLGTGATGIAVQSAGEVMVVHCAVRDFAAAGVSLATSAHARVTIAGSVIFNSGVGVLVNPLAAGAHAKIFTTLLLANAGAGVRVVGAGNDVVLSGNQVLGSLKALDLEAGALATSYGDNVLTSGDMPGAEQPKG